MIAQELLLVYGTYIQQVCRPSAKH